MRAQQQRMAAAPQPEPMAAAVAAVAAAVASPRVLGGGGGGRVASPVIIRNDDGTLGLSLYKGQMGFGVNVSELAVVLDTRSNAEEAGVAKGQLIVAINGTATPTKQAVHTVLKGCADSANFSVREPSLMDARARRKELVTIRMKKGWKTHWVLTIKQSYVFVVANFHSGPEYMSQEPVLTRKSLGSEADEKQGGTISGAFQVRTVLCTLYSVLCTVLSRPQHGTMLCPRLPCLF